ncbi:MAG: GTPase HflX [Gammaproteobacteria bacterium]|nr:GTPase HflX [Gammaproteobacteria bacterium]
MFDRPRANERAVLVHIRFSSNQDDQIVEEFVELARAAGAEPVAKVSGKRSRPDAKLFIGSGKAEEIQQIAQENDAQLVIFNHSLSPGQERNLEKLLNCRVLDRTGLILDIFAQRAHSFEGKLQVELAQLRHLSTRLVRGWTHLERQKGGIGLRGPGETQLETDRRLISKRIKLLKQRLEKVAQQREGRRQTRRKRNIQTVSLVGYTNAGKSTLFNRLTGADAYCADQLFATLDPTLRRVSINGGEHIVLADTVGFVSDLPHDLVAAFRATLEETREANLLLHVVDATAQHQDDVIVEVEAVLKEIGADEVRIIQVFNKIDRLDESKPRIERDNNGIVRRVWLSAVTGQGTDLLRQVLKEICLDGEPAMPLAVKKEEQGMGDDEDVTPRIYYGV